MEKKIPEMRDGELMLYAAKGADWAKRELERRRLERQNLPR